MAHADAGVDSGQQYQCDHFWLGDLLFRQRVDGVWLASPIQTYLDLLRAEGRAKESAVHLRRTRIGL